MKIRDKLLNYSRRWEYPDVYLFTGNPIIKNNGAIVMGRGAAKQIRDTYPDIDIQFGDALRAKPDAHIVWIKVKFHSKASNPMQRLGWFKVKDHWKDPARLSLIQESSNQLREIAERNPDITFHMNFPGVGNGGLQDHLVLPLLETLPDNVWIYR